MPLVKRFEVQPGDLVEEVLDLALVECAPRRKSPRYHVVVALLAGNHQLGTFEGFHRRGSIELYIEPYCHLTLHGDLGSPRAPWEVNLL